MEIEDWNFENRRRGSFQKFQKNDFQKIFKTQYPMKKCLFLTPFFQLTILNFRLGSLRIFEKVPITKSKMYFLGVWRKKIFYEFRWVFEKVHIEFFVLGYDWKMNKNKLSFKKRNLKKSIQDFDQNQFKILIRVENKNLFQKLLITIWIRLLIRVENKNRFELVFSNIWNWTFSKSWIESLEQILETIENWNLFKEPFQNLEFIFDQTF